MKTVYPLQTKFAGGIIIGGALRVKPQQPIFKNEHALDRYIIMLHSVYLKARISLSVDLQTLLL